MNETAKSPTNGIFTVSIIFYAQNRFRAVTIEPYYLMYACSFFIYLLEDKFRLLKKKILSFIDYDLLFFCKFL